MSGKTTLRWAFALVYMAWIHVWTATGGRNPSSSLPFGVDKIVHLCEFGLLAWLLWRPWRETLPHWAEGKTAAFVLLLTMLNGLGGRVAPAVSAPQDRDVGRRGGGRRGRRGRRLVVSPPREGKAPQNDAGIGEYTLSSIRDALTEDMKAAMRARETLRLSTIRMVRAEILNKDKESGEETSQKDILKLLQSMVKKREEAAEQYAAAGREDMAQQERDEIQIIEGYLPAQMDDAEIESAARAVIEETGASSMKDMGKVMGILSRELAGRATGARISQAVRKLLGT